jgi:glycosyltransferase involved in cell wall biosynthesis
VKDRLKITYISRTTIPFPNADGINIVNTCGALSELGHDVILALGWKFWRLPRMFVNPWDFYGIPPLFEIRRIFEIPKTSLFFDKQALGIARSRGSLVWTRYPGIVPRALRRGLNCVFEIHEVVSGEYLVAAEEIIESPNGVAIVAVSEAVRDYVMAHLNSSQAEEKIVIAGSSADTRRFQSVEISGKEGEKAGDRPTVGYVGSFYPGKCLEIIIPLAERMPRVRFLLYGRPSTMRRELAVRARKLANLEFKGFVRPRDVPEIMKQFTIALLPNQPKVEVIIGDIGRFTSPLKLIEYMAAGKAVVASDLPVIREIIRDGENGLLAPHDGIAAWERILTELLNDKEKRSRLAETARKQAEKEFTYKARVSKILEFILPRMQG